MKRVFECRRTFIALVAIVCLTFIGYHKGIDVGMAIASVAVGLAGANAYQGKPK